MKEAGSTLRSAPFNFGGRKRSDACDAATASRPLGHCGQAPPWPPPSADPLGHRGRCPRPPRPFPGGPVLIGPCTLNFGGRKRFGAFGACIAASDRERGALRLSLPVAKRVIRRRPCTSRVCVHVAGPSRLCIIGACCNRQTLLFVARCRGRASTEMCNAACRDCVARLLQRASINAKSSKSLAAARKQAASREILLWMTPSEAPKALQASECSELLDPMRASRVSLLKLRRLVTCAARACFPGRASLRPLAC